MATQIEPHVFTLFLVGILYSHDRDGSPLAYPAMPAAKRLWKKVGDHLTSEVIKQNPGCRPFAWWLWSRPATLPPPNFDWLLAERGAMNAVDYRHRERPSTFSQQSYLQAHGLLTPEERTAIDALEARWAKNGT